jgi:hypothetical protein
MHVSEFLSRLNSPKKTGRGWQAHCPAHDDRQASLSVREGGDGRILLKCFAGCRAQEVVAALGLSLKDLFAERPARSRRRQEPPSGPPITVEMLARDKRLPAPFLRTLGLRDDPRYGVVVPYRDESGATFRERRRRALKAADGSSWAPGEGVIAYGLDRLEAARAAGSLTLVEGESDCWTLWHFGFPALGAPGATMTKTLSPDFLGGIPLVYIVQEPDAAGAQFVAETARQIRSGWIGEVRVVRLDGVKDPNDLLKQTGPAGFAAAWQAALDAAPPLAAPAAPAPALPVIQLNGRNQRDIIDDAWAAYFALAARTPPATHLYQRGGEIVRLVLDPEYGAPFVKTVGDAEFHNFAGRWATWAKVTDEGVVPGSPPIPIARAMRAVPHPDLPRVEEIVTVPFFDENLELVAAPGYHAASHVFLHSGVAVAAIPENPTAEQAYAAVDYLTGELFCDFPFVSPSDQCHAVALLLLPFVRRAIHGATPMHLIEAPAAGSGKSLLADLVQLVFSGVAAATTTGRDEEETRKKITSLLDRGERIIVMDNVRGGLDSAQIASALTLTVWTDRALGTNRIVAAPNRAVWVFTGNNLDLSQELARRSVRVRIDAETDRPFERAGFKHDPIREWTLAHRPELIAAALTLIQYWKARGRVPGGKRLGSFEAWSACLGGIFAAAGFLGFLGNQDALYEESDAKSAEWKAFIEVWGRELGAGDFTARELVTFALEHNALDELLGDDSSRVQVIRLGKQLRRARDMTIRNWKLVSRHDDHGNRQLWKLEPVQRGLSQNPA